MACLDMYSSSSSSSSNQNSKAHSSCITMSPRISFSNDFAESNHSHQQQMLHKPRSSESPASASSDFEFSVTNYSMMSADELFFKGQLLPSFKKPPTTTLREELLVEDDDEEEDFSLRPPKGWKEILGLKKAHIGSKKPPTKPVEKEAHASKSSQEVLNEGGSSCRAVELGI